MNEARRSAEGARAPAWLWAGFWVCIVIAIAVVARRMVALLHPSQGGPPQLAELDRAFASHAGLTMAHIVPAAVFVVLAAVVLAGRQRRAWVEWMFFVFGAITGLTAYAMSAYVVGGAIELSAVLVFDTYFLVSLGYAFAWWRRGDYERQRRWTVRAVVVLLGIATTRPVMGVFFATSPLTGMGPHQFFGIAFWIGFAVNVLVVETWLRSRKRAEMRGYIVSPGHAR